MAMRFLIAAGLAVALLGAASAQTVSRQQKLETCSFGADSQKLTGAKRKSFMAKCMSDKDSPRGKPVGAAPR
jgi:opacity protein-like surface antigen